MSEAAAQPDVLGGNAQGQLKGIVERINNLLNDRDDLNADIREVYAECAAFGFDKKTVRKVVAISRQDKAKRQEEEAILDLYLAAVLGE